VPGRRGVDLHRGSHVHRLPVIAVAAGTVAALDQFGWLDEQQREELRPWRAEVMTGIRGAPVGAR